MIEVETAYNPDAPLGWNCRLVEDHNINASAANGAGGHNWQTAEMNYVEMQDLFIAPYNELRRTNLGKDDFTWTQGELWRNPTADDDLVVIDFKDMEQT